MTFRVTTANAADRDIREIVNYIGTDSPAASEHFIEELAKLFVLIAENPSLGRPVSGLGLPLRRIRVSQRFYRYSIYYRDLDPERLEVVRVLHSARNIADILATLK